MDGQLLAQLAAEIKFPLAPSVIVEFGAFEEALFEANQVKNLTTTPRLEWPERHFIDSLLIQEFCPENARVLDIGSGPGFPSWPLAAARPDLQLVAVDSNAKMLGFLRAHLLPNLETWLGRIEDFDWIEEFDIVTGRALAPLPIQLELSAASCRIGGAVVPMRTAKDSFELSMLGKLGLELEKVEYRMLPLQQAKRAFPIYRKVRPTSREFPRRWAEIKKAPLT